MFFNELSSTQVKTDNFDNLPDNTILVTLNATALYSSIPLNDSIGTCKEYLDRRALSTTFSEDICQLIKLILLYYIIKYIIYYYIIRKQCTYF